MGHHYLPQRLLRGFAHETKFIWMLDKRGGQAPRSLPISRVANEPDMYTNDLEGRLNNEIEQPFNAVLDHLGQQLVLRPHDIEPLCRYVVALHRRVPLGRERSRQAFPDVSERVEREHLQHIDQLENQMQALVPGPAPLAESARANIRRIHQELRGRDTDWIWHGTLEPEMFPRLVALLGQMTWSIGRVPPDRQLLIGDNPVLFDESLGLAHERAELVLPIRRDLLLHAAWRKVPGGVCRPLSAQQVRRVNQITAQRAQRWLFFSREEGWIPRFVDRITQQDTRKSSQPIAERSANTIP